MGRPSDDFGGGFHSSSSHSSSFSDRDSSSHQSGYSRSESSFGTDSGWSDSSYGYSDFDRVSSGYGYGRRAGPGPYKFKRIDKIVIAVMIIFVFGVPFLRTGANLYEQWAAIPRSSTNCERLEINASYQTNNVYDELDWINASKVSRELRKFYDTTGIQPALALFDYMDGVTGNDAKQDAYAKEWYADHVEGECGVLLAYFDTGTDAEGTAYLIYGNMVKPVFDKEAEDVFWGYYDRYWTDNNIELTDAYPAIFNETVKRIMVRTITSDDVFFVIYIIVCVGMVIGGIIAIMVLRRKHAAEKAAETERILNIDLNTSSDADADALADKYNK